MQHIPPSFSSSRKYCLQQTATTITHTVVTVFVTLSLLYRNSRAKFVCISISALAFTIAAHRYSIYSTDRTHLPPSNPTLPCLRYPRSKTLTTAYHSLKNTATNTRFSTPLQPPRTHQNASGLFQAGGAFSIVRLTSMFVADSSSEARPQLSCHALEYVRETLEVLIPSVWTTVSASPT